MRAAETTTMTTAVNPPAATNPLRLLAWRRQVLLPCLVRPSPPPAIRLALLPCRRCPIDRFGEHPLPPHLPSGPAPAPAGSALSSGLGTSPVSAARHPLATIRTVRRHPARRRQSWTCRALKSRGRRLATCRRAAGVAQPAPRGRRQGCRGGKQSPLPSCTRRSGT